MSTLAKTIVIVFYRRRSFWVNTSPMDITHDTEKKQRWICYPVLVLLSLECVNVIVRVCCTRVLACNLYWLLAWVLMRSKKKMKKRAESMILE